MKIFLKFEGQTQIWTQDELRDLQDQNEKYGNTLMFISEGKVCNSRSTFSNNQTVVVQSKLLGGKGGFGAKLKTEGGKKVRPNENMFSRDLQGQPVSYATTTRQYEEYYRKKLIQDQKVQKQLAEYQVVSNAYKEDYASTKLDNNYNAEMQENQKRLKEAMKVGMKKYLEKKNEDLQKSQEEKQEEQKQEDKDEVGEKFSEDEVNDQEQDKNEKVQENKEEEIMAVKRQKPIGKVDQQEKKEPQKRVKLNENEVQKKIEPIQNKSSGEKLLSARQKLKSLFKK